MRKSLKSTAWLIISVFSCMAVSCGEEKDGPDSSDSPKSLIVGRWQKYATVENDGSLQGGDPDEFWIFNSDGSFENEDSGEIVTRGSYSIEKNILTIMSREVGGDREEENFTGTFEIEGKYMDYTFTEIGKDDFVTYRFLKH